MPSSPFTFGFPLQQSFFNEPRWSIAKAPMTWFCLKVVSDHTFLLLIPNFDIITFLRIGDFHFWLNFEIRLYRLSKSLWVVNHRLIRWSPAAYPRSMRPQTSSIPTDFAGTRLAIVRASCGVAMPHFYNVLNPLDEFLGCFLQATAVFNRAVPSFTITGNSPSIDSHSPIPPARMQSVIRGLHGRDRNISSRYLRSLGGRGDRRRWVRRIRLAMWVPRRQHLVRGGVSRAFR